jgi:uncharacterized protein YodC (DUF2158 family)
VRRDGTLSSVATGEHTVVIGAYRLSDGKAASYSATGPSVRDKGRDGPDASAVGDDSVACLGVLGASTLTPNRGSQLCGRIRENDMDAKYGTGDLVWLASGSPLLTVADRIEMDGGGFAYLCQWVDAKGIPQQQTYLEATLILCN